MTTEQTMAVPTVEELETKKIELMTQLGQEAIKGTDEGLAAVKNITKAIEECNKQIKDIKYQETKGERDAWGEVLTDAIGSINPVDYVDGLDVIVQGANMHDPEKRVIKVAINANKLHDAVVGMIGDILLQTPETVHSFSYSSEGMVLNNARRATETTNTANSGNTTGSKGKGWTRDGQSMPIDEAFNLVATEAEKSELTAPDLPRWKPWQIKQRVVKKAGFTQNA